MERQPPHERVRVEPEPHGLDLLAVTGVQDTLPGLACLLGENDVQGVPPDQMDDRARFSHRAGISGLADPGQLAVHQLEPDRVDPRPRRERWPR